RPWRPKAWFAPQPARLPPWRTTPTKDKRRQLCLTSDFLPRRVARSNARVFVAHLFGYALACAGIAGCLPAELCAAAARSASIGSVMTKNVAPAEDRSSFTFAPFGRNM